MHIHWHAAGYTRHMVNFDKGCPPPPKKRNNNKGHIQEHELQQGALVQRVGTTRAATLQRVPLHKSYYCTDLMGALSGGIDREKHSCTS